MGLLETEEVKLSVLARIVSVAVLAVCAASTASVAQEVVPKIRLTTYEAALSEPFSSVAGLRELSDGRVLVSDRLEQALRLVDFASGGFEQIGQTGQGPGEYRMPGDLLPLPADSTLLVDLGNMRMMYVTPDGRLEGSESLVRPEGIFMFPQGADALGRIYFDVTGTMAMTPGSLPDSFAIVVFDRGTQTTDTIGLLPREQIRRLRTGGAGTSFSGPGMAPFEPADAWAAAPNGRVAVARGADYRLEWLARGQERIVGPAVEYEPIRVTDDDKEAWADRMSQGAAVMVMAGGGGGSGSGRTMNIPRPDVDEMEWPDVKPAFPRGAVNVTPEGEAWVQRYVEFGEPQTFDVFDASGRRVRQVVLPEGRRFIGFGEGTLYAVRVDEDDLQWLERYRR